MSATAHLAELDERFSEPGVTPTPWEEAREHLERSRIFWLTTVRADGRPHTTPVIAVWHDEAVYFCTGPDEQKARNLEGSRHCTLTTGTNSLDEGLDLVIEGQAVRVHDEHRLEVIARAYLAKYGHDWTFEVDGEAFTHQDGGRALVFQVVPATVFGFRKGPYSQTRWRFPAVS